MATIDGALQDFRRLDRLAAGESALHRLDPRTKVLATLAFIVAVVSFGKYELSALIPFFLFPAVVMGAADLPVRYLAGKVAFLCPFALMVGIFNPIFDHAVLLQWGPFAITGGWISFASIALKAVLTVSAALILVAVTGFPAICTALQRLGMPSPFAMQLIFLYRYLFVLTEEGGRAARARELRSLGKKGHGIDSYTSLIGNLLLRTWQRAERVHMAMLGRGFHGTFPGNAASRFGPGDLFFLVGWSAFFIIMRLYNGPRFIGALVTGAFR